MKLPNFLKSILNLDVPEIETPEEKFIQSLKITFKDNRYISWDCKSSNDSHTIEPWKKFYKWYFGRPQSLYFTIEYDKGWTTINRREIKLVESFVSKVLT